MQRNSQSPLDSPPGSGRQRKTPSLCCTNDALHPCKGFLHQGSPWRMADVEVAATQTVPAEGIPTVNVEEATRLKTDGNTLFAKGEVDIALAQYRAGLAVAPKKPLLDPSVATEDAESVSEVEMDTTDYTITAQLYSNAGLCLMRLSEIPEAIAYLSEAIRHDPTYAKALLRRAECYYLSEKYPSAYADYESAEKYGCVLDAQSQQRKAVAKEKQDEEMKKMLGDLKDLGNKCLGFFGLSTDNFKFDKDPSTGSYSMRFER
eukprot:gene4396-3197_t